MMSPVKYVWVVAATHWPPGTDLSREPQDRKVGPCRRDSSPARAEMLGTSDIVFRSDWEDAPALSSKSY